eukprot:7158186-Lingulodinium_polyedra.AAC.1
MVVRRRPGGPPRRSADRMVTGWAPLRAFPSLMETTSFWLARSPARGGWSWTTTRAPLRGFGGRFPAGAVAPGQAEGTTGRAPPVVVSARAHGRVRHFLFEGGGRATPIVPEFCRPAARLHRCGRGPR